METVSSDAKGSGQDITELTSGVREMAIGAATGGERLTLSPMTNSSIRSPKQTEGNKSQSEEDGQLDEGAGELLHYFK